MTLFRDIARTLVALFVDDELLAVGVLVVVTITAVSILILGAAPLFAGVFLLLGNVIVLIAGAVRTAHREPRT